MAPLERGTGIITHKTSQLVFGTFRHARQAFRDCVSAAAAFIYSYSIRQFLFDPAIRTQPVLARRCEMTAADLWAEYRPALANPHTEAALAKYGVTDPAATLICGLTRISPLINLYEPSDNGDHAVSVPVFDGDELWDLIAFDPRRPEVWWCRSGGEPLLGINWLAFAGPKTIVPIFATPLAWLQAGCAGVVILDKSKSFADLCLYGLPELWVMPEMVAA